MAVLSYPYIKHNLPTTHWVPHSLAEICWVYHISFPAMDITPSMGGFNSTGNSTHPGIKASGLPTTSIVTIVIYSLAVSIIVIGNGLVLFGLARFKVLRHHSNIFVGVLSTVDMTLSVSFIMISIQSVNPTLFRGLHFCQLRTILPNANLLASELLLLGMYTFKIYSEIW